MTQEPLTGGNSNQVYKEGDTVVRNVGNWSPFVHQLLRHLTASGFQQSPVLIEHNATHERLTFFDGDVGNYPLQPYMRTDAMLIEAAQLLRKLHDATLNMVIPADAVFQLPLRAAPEVICHNDFAPYNLVFRDNHIVGIIDFDTASPGTRLWDIAYAVYRFAPLAADEHAINCGFQPLPDRAARLKLFCDAYGLENRAPLLETVKARLQALIDHMTSTASNLDHLPVYYADLQFLDAHHAELAAALNA